MHRPSIDLIRQPLAFAVITSVLLAGSTTPSRITAQTHFDGTGTVVAVIGSGVDYTHQQLGGPGSAAAYSGNDPGVVEPGSFPTAKVIGGYDFAGPRYSAACPTAPFPDTDCSRVAEPDDDPLDMPDGRGTAMAGVAAGIAGGTGAGAIPPGVAPGARLVALKVFGNPQGPGVAVATELIDDAIDWVIRHNRAEPVPGIQPADGATIDVILIQPGAAWSANVAEINASVNAAVAAGITVIAPVGDDGPLPFIAGTPGSADLALAVAAATGDDVSTWGIRATWDEAGQEARRDIEAVEGGAWLPTLASVGPIQAELAWYGQACDEASGDPQPPVQEVRERIALIERGTCTFPIKLANAAQFGAVAVVMYSDQRPRSAMPCGTPCTAQPGIPGVMIDRQPGLDLRQRLESGTAVALLLDPELAIPLPWLHHILVATGSRGPGRASGPIKPQLTAVGANVAVPRAGSGTLLSTGSSTRHAAAQAAGHAARLVQRSSAEQLDIRGADVAAMLINFADPIVHLVRRDSGPLAPVLRQGAGQLDPVASMAGTTLLRSEGGLAELGFGDVRIAGASQRLRRKLRLRNLAAQPRHYRAGFRLAFPEEDGAAVSMLFEPTELTVAAGGTAEIDAVLHIDGSQLRPWTLDAGNAVSDTARLQLHEIDGFVDLREIDASGQPVDNGDTVGAPLYLLPRRASCIEATVASPFALRVDGPPAIQTWQNPCAEAGLVRPTVRVGSDPAESATNPDFAPSVDIESVGLRYGRPREGDPDAPTVLEWHVRTRGSRRVPMDAVIDILLDLDRNGGFDRVLTTTYGPAARGAAGRWFTVNAPLLPGTLDPDLSRQLPNPLLLRYDLDEAVTILRASADDLLIDPASGGETFDFAVRARDAQADRPVTGRFPGFDDAPDGLAVGEVYSFDQRQFECLRLEGPAGEPLGGIDGELEVPGGGSASMRLTIHPDCMPPEPDPNRAGVQAAVLMSYPGNATAAQQAQLWWGRVGGGRGVIYLPFAATPTDAASNHSGRVE